MERLLEASQLTDTDLLALAAHPGDRLVSFGHASAAKEWLAAARPCDRGPTTHRAQP